MKQTWPVITRRRALALGLAGFLLGALAAPMPVRAEVNVAGTAAAIRIVADRDGVADVLDAMQAAFNMRYRTSIPLDAVISGSYSGSLKEVLARLLDGYTYVIKHDGEATEVVVFGKRGQPVAVPPPAGPAKTFATQWR